MKEAKRFSIFTFHRHRDVSETGRLEVQADRRWALMKAIGAVM